MWFKTTISLIYNVDNILACPHLCNYDAVNTNHYRSNNMIMIIRSIYLIIFWMKPFCCFEINQQSYWQLLWSLALNNRVNNVLAFIVNTVTLGKMRHECMLGIM